MSSRMNSGKKPTYYCIQVSAAWRVQVLLYLLLLSSLFFMNMHIGEKTSICFSLLADSILSLFEAVHHYEASEKNDHLHYI